MSYGYKFECGACQTEVAQIIPPQLRTIPIETSFNGRKSWETVALQCCMKCCEELDKELAEQRIKADKERQRVPLRSPEERAAIFGGKPEDYGGTSKPATKARTSDGKFAKKTKVNRPEEAPPERAESRVDRLETKIDKLTDAVGALIGALTNGQSQAAQPKRRNPKVLSRDE